MNVKKALVALAATAAVAVPVVASAAPAQAAVASQTRVEQEFMFDVRTYYPEARNARTLVRIGRANCDLLAQGTPVRTIVKAGTDAGVPSDFVTTVLSAAVVNFCPSKFGVVAAAYSTTAA